MTSQIITASIPPPSVSGPVDTLELTGVNSIGINDIRPLKSFLKTQPLQGPVKTIIIHPADILTVAAQNALLKILEEPPPYAQITLVTLNPQSLLPTILSRCELIPHSSFLIPHSSSVPPLLASLSQPATPAQALALAAKIKTTRPEILKDLETCLRHLAHQLLASPEPSLSREAGLLLAAHQAIAKNANLSLSLSHLFLHWTDPS